MTDEKTMYEAENQEEEQQDEVEIVDDEDASDDEYISEEDEVKEKVDLDKDERAKIEKRLATLYKETRIRKDTIHKQAELIQELTGRLNSLEATTKTTANQSALSALQAQYKEAIEYGEDGKASDIMQQIIDLKVEQKISPILEKRLHANQITTLIFIVHTGIQS